MRRHIPITLSAAIFVAGVVAPSSLAGTSQGLALDISTACWPRPWLVGSICFGARRAPVQGPDSLILQGPGSDIRASVVILPENRRPQGQGGVLVDQVVRDGPADSAGLRRGDIVTEFDGIAITDPVQFGKVVRDTPPRRSVKVIVWRDGSRREMFIAPVAARPQ